MSDFLLGVALAALVSIMLPCPAVDDHAVAVARQACTANEGLKHVRPERFTRGIYVTCNNGATFFKDRL